MQLSKLKSFIEKRKKIFKIYSDAGLSLLGNDLSKNLKPVRYRAVIRTSNPKKIIDKLNSNKIRSIIPIEKWELLSGKSKFKNSIRMTEETLSLPIYPTLSLKDAKRIAQIAADTK